MNPQPMSKSILNKYTRSFMLLASLLLMTDVLTAQISKAFFFAPLSIDFKKIEFDSTYSASEFTQAMPFETPHVPSATIDTLKVESTLNTTVVANETQKTVEEVKDSVKTEPIIAENMSLNTIIQDSTCIDLAFDSVSVVQITEKFVEIEYSIINRGTAPAPIFGAKRSNSDNVAIHFYYSGTPRLNRGSILAEGIYLTEGLRQTKGMLAPNAVYKNKFKLSLEKKNRFYGVIILQLDAFDILSHECDETNNVFSIVPKWY